MLKILKKPMLKFLKKKTPPRSYKHVYVTQQAVNELPEDDALALKHVGAINTEQYNKLPVTAHLFACCACSNRMHSTTVTVTVK
jgi:hypothetical protein